MAHFYREIGLEVAFETTLQNRKPQMRQDEDGKMKKHGPQTMTFMHVMWR